jgi:hypothetical protein
MVEALQFYSPESKLTELTGCPGQLKGDQGGKWEPFQGKLLYGDVQVRIVHTSNSISFFY